MGEVRSRVKYRMSVLIFVTLYLLHLDIILRLLVNFEKNDKNYIQK